MTEEAQERIARYRRAYRAANGRDIGVTFKRGFYHVDGLPSRRNAAAIDDGTENLWQIAHGRLLERLGGALALLEDSRSTFEEYARHHRAKAGEGQERLDRAERNEDLAERIGAWLDPVGEIG